MLKQTWEKVFEYASSPLHGTLSRKQRPGVKIQVNEGEVFENAVFFLGEEFVRITETKGSDTVNLYYDWNQLASIKTVSKKD